MKVEVGDLVVYVDPRGKPRRALVTAVWGPEVYPYPHGGGPSINLVLVSDDPAKQDMYGRQIERETSVVHMTTQPAPGNYWRGWDELSEGVTAPPASTEVQT